MSASSSKIAESCDGLDKALVISRWKTVEKRLDRLAVDRERTKLHLETLDAQEATERRRAGLIADRLREIQDATRGGRE